MNKLTLTNDEMAAIGALLKEITAEHQTTEHPEFLGLAPVFAQELPRRLRVFLSDFKHLEPPSGFCIVSGYPIKEEKIGKTPSHWHKPAPCAGTIEEEVYLVLLGSLLGDLLGWATQQNGSLVHEILPIRAHENEQLGTGSKQLLTWHTEDAFHPYRGDYLGMMCMRNPQQAATTCACMDDIKLSRQHLDILFEPRFTIRPDESHNAKNNPEPQKLNADCDLREAYHRIAQMDAQPPKLAVLFGDKRSPYVRIDPYFMDSLPEDPEAQEALDTLVHCIDERIADLVMEQGEVVFIDNFRTVHGRRPFTARYDGNDRWLKRINITRDIRKSREARSSCASRVIT